MIQGTERTIPSILIFYTPSPLTSTFREQQQCTHNALQFSLSGLQRLEQKVADITRSLVKVEAHSGAAETFRDNVKLNTEMWLAGDLI
jgi:hypothetical protein